MTSSSSSSSSEGEASEVEKKDSKEKDKDKKKKSKKKQKKDKKEKGEKDKEAKKAKKKEKKDKKAEKKAEKRKAKADTWDCDIAYAARLIAQLLELDPMVFVELGECIFDKLDVGEEVNIDTLQSKHLKKKLRHLLHAMRIEGDGKCFSTPDKKVSFRAVFEICLKEAQSRQKAAQVASAATTAGSVASNKDRVAPGSDPKAQAEREGPDDAMEPSLPASAPHQRPKRKGPELPSPGIFACDAEAEEQGSDSDDQHALGPKIEGAERQGVDLRDLPRGKQKREEWMTAPGKSMAGLFGQG